MLHGYARWFESSLGARQKACFLALRLFLYVLGVAQIYMQTANYKLACASTQSGQGFLRLWPSSPTVLSFYTIHSIHLTKHLTVVQYERMEKLFKTTVYIFYLFRYFCHNFNKIIYSAYTSHNIRKHIFERVCSAKIQIRLSICAVWSQFSQGTFWIITSKTGVCRGIHYFSYFCLKT